MLPVTRRSSWRRSELVTDLTALKNSGGKPGAADTRKVDSSAAQGDRVVNTELAKPQAEPSRLTPARWSARRPPEAGRRT